MKRMPLVMLTLVILAGAVSADDASDRIAFYDVALTCSSAPKLGCGSRAKRVLAALTADPRVAAAWVNEAGTRLAIAWSQPASSLAVAQVNAILEPHALAVNPIDDKSRAELSASLRTHRGWFDSQSIDELSRKESAVIAERLVKRVAKRVPVTETQSTVLVKAIMSSCWDRGGCQVEQDVTSIAKQAKLNRAGLHALRDAVALGYQPLANEE